MDHFLREEGGRRNGELQTPYQQTVLAFDGGGIRGYASLKVLEHIMECIRIQELHDDSLLRQSRGLPYDRARDPMTQSPPLPCHYFDYIVGTSTGGLIAVMLGRLRMHIRHCIHEYMGLGLKIFSRKRLFRFDRYDHHTLQVCITDVVRRYCFDVDSLKDGRDRMYQEDAAEGTACRTVVLAVEKRHAEADRIHPFTSYHYWPDTRDRSRHEVHPDHRDPRAVHIYNAARATSAAPGYFKVVEVCGSLFMDGAILENNPSVWAWKEAWDRFPRQPIQNGTVENVQNPEGPELERTNSCRIGVFLSIGTGIRAPRTAFHSGYPWGQMRKLLRKAIGSLTDTEAVHIQMQRTAAEHSNDHYYRFNPGGLEKMGIAECKSKDRTFRDMDAAVLQYIGTERQRLDECARALVKQRRGRWGEARLLEFRDLTRPGPRCW